MDEGDSNIENKDVQNEDNFVLSEILGEKSGKAPVNDEDAIKIRKEKIVSFLKTKYDWISYVLLAFVVYIAVKIRSGNLPGLRDITTNDWTLGPDLDPFLFLRWAKDIVETGSLIALDNMRYVPLGFKTNNEFILHPFLIAWFHKIAVFFGSESVEQSAAVFPVFMFALTVISFYLFTRILFVDKLGNKQANVIAIFSSFLLSVLPSILPRTIAGIPEKESAAFLFLFLAFYFFIAAWKSKNNGSRIILSLLAGLSTTGMALIWGGFGYIFITIAIVTLVSFILGQIDKSKFMIYSIWLITSLTIMIFSADRYNFLSMPKSVTTGIAILVFFIISVHFLLFKSKYLQKISGYLRSGKLKIVPEQITSLIVALIIGIILASILFGPSFIFDKVSGLSDNLIKPATSRLIQTVAENRQPYFGEWSGNFGPKFQGIPVFFWLFFTGSIYLFYNMTKPFKMKERYTLSLAYLVFLISIIFSRYARDHRFNGENTISLFLYFGGVLLFMFSIGFYYFKYYKSNEMYKFKSIDFGYMLLFSFFVLGIISARGAVRLIMVLVPPTAIIVSYASVSGFNRAMKISDKTKKWMLLIPVLIFIIFSIYAANEFYQSSSSSAKGFVPSVYSQQWQKAMSWVRENTAENAVFGHWWDYGYWLQGIGERATVLDGGNVISYWNHLMGRHALTGPDEMKALEFLHAHDTTHFLIDSTDIGKYGAFSNIGSDETYDRASFIVTFQRDDSQTQEKKDSSVFLYPGGVVLDDDLKFSNNGEEIFLPRGAAGLGGVIIEKNTDGKINTQPIGIYVYQNQRYDLPLRYLYSNGELKDFGEGIEAGVFLMAKIDPNSQGGQINPDGTLLYLSERTVNSQLARLYLYGEETEFFKVAHIESDLVISNIRGQGVEIGEFVYFQGIRGPIKIWEINYPEEMQLNEEFLETKYPESLKIA